tara:strand:- start:1268 stop:2095 length:828 start_codon:yes stop_codon:yes gene_type:complete
MAIDPITGIDTNVGSESNIQNKQSISDFLTNVNQFMSNLRSRNLSPGAEPASAKYSTANFKPSNESVGEDWRVRISVPDISTFRSSPILAPLAQTANNVVFPLVPNITFQHTANYNLSAPTHSNYPFPIYESSSVEPFVIAGEFPVQTEDDGRYWIAAVHFFKSVTKMAFGETSNKGSPPPLVKVNGYGQYVLNNVPCVVQNFNYSLENGVDYIRVPIRNSFTGTQNTQSAEEYSWVPTLSTMSVTLQPTYSRIKAASFSLDKFVNGDLKNEGFL